MAIPIADRWFEKLSVEDDVTLIYEPHVVPLLRCNIWHVRGRDRDLMIDTGTGLVSLVDFARDVLAKRVTAVATHVHLDHVGGHHEFEECLVHASEASGLSHPSGEMNLVDERFDPFDLTTLYLPSPGTSEDSSDQDLELEGAMVTALPYAGFESASYCLRPAKGIGCVGDGDIIDLGDRAFEVLHLPGHSPGSIGLWEAATATLFSGDTLYDGPLIDDLHHSDRQQYRHSLERLRGLPVTTVHAGHDPSFGRARLQQLIDQQIEHWENA